MRRRVWDTQDTTTQKRTQRDGEESVCVRTECGKYGMAWVGAVERRVLDGDVDRPLRQRLVHDPDLARRRARWLSACSTSIAQ